MNLDEYYEAGTDQPPVLRGVASGRFVGHGLYDRLVFCGPTLKSNSRAFASICELDSSGKPFMGQATMHVSNVIPLDDGNLEVVGHVQWNSNISLRLSVFWM
ncbi:hypothetical protein ACFO9E_27515 [Streptomyces maoxianensis]|uniref:Uncharacterized protein n=1 Tax=Streptomyces maoxianensis TaxID=1459942 RepID=A0ABV9GED9_9ACTN